MRSLFCFRILSCFFLLFAFISGCQRSGFNIDRVSLEGPVESHFDNEKWPFVRTKTFPIKICARDTSSFIPIMDMPFVLFHADLTPIATKNTDFKGCTIFSIKVKYNELAPENWITWKGSIKGEDAYPQSVPVELGLNPWTSEVVDLHHSYDFSIKPVAQENADAALLGRDKFHPNFESSTSNLLIKTFPIEISSIQTTPSSAILKTNIRFTPYYRWKKLSGNFDHPKLVSFGRFQIDITVIEKEPASEKRTWLGRTSHVMTQNFADSVVQIQNLSIALRNSERTQGALLEWVVRVTPLDEYAGLMPFTGILETPMTLLGKGTLQSDLIEVPVKSQLATKLLPVVTTVPEPVRPLDPTDILESSKTRKSTFGISISGVTLFQDGSFDSNSDSYQAAVGAQVTHLCLHDRLTGNLLRRHKVRAFLSDNSDFEIKDPKSDIYYTGADGCFGIEKTLKVHFDYLKNPCYLKKYLLIESLEEDYQNVRTGMELYLNPWQRGNRLFFWDSKQGIPEKQLCTEGISKDEIPLELNHVSTIYEPQYASIEVDKALRLTQKSMFRFALTPQLYRKFVSGNESGFAERREDLWLGTKLKVRAIFAGLHYSKKEETKAEASEPKNQKDDNNFVRSLRFLSDYETEVVVSEQKGNRNVALAPLVFAFDFNEKPLLESFVQVFLELSPAKGSALKFKPVTVRVEFDPLKTSEQHLEYRVSDVTLDELSESLAPKNSFEPSRLLTPEKKDVLKKPRLNSKASNLERLKTLPDFPKTVVYLDLDESNHDSRWPKEWKSDALSPQALGFYLRMKESSKNLLEKPSVEATSFSAPLIREFCRAYVSLNSKAKADCDKNAFEVLSLDALEIVKDVHSARKERLKTTQIQVMARFFKENIDTRRLFKGVHQSDREDSALQTKFGVDAMGTGSGVHRLMGYQNQTFWAAESSITFDERDRSEVRELDTLLVEKSSASMDVSFQRCFLIRPRPALWVDEKTESPSYLVCATLRAPVLENWYYISDAIRRDGVADWDRKHLEYRYYLKTVRGEALYNDFTKTLQKDLVKNNIVLIPVGKFIMGTEPLMKGISEPTPPFSDIFSSLADDGGVFPGVLRYRNFSEELKRLKAKQASRALERNQKTNY